MSGLSYVGTLSVGADAYDVALSDLQTFQSDNGLILGALARSGGGFVTYSIGATQTTLAAVTNVPSAAQAGQRARIVDLGDGAVMLTGVNGTSVTHLDISAQGLITSTSTQSGIAGVALSTDAVLVNDTHLVLAGPNQSHTTYHSLSATGSLQNTRTFQDFNSTFSDAIGALASGSDATSRVLVVGSQSEYGITTYTLHGNTLRAQASFGPEEGLGIMVPTDIEIITHEGRSFVIVSSSAGHVGTAGAVTVLEVDALGALTPTDHVLDTLHSRFGTAQCIEAIAIGDRAFVVVGGGDHGLSLFELTQTGQLIHLQSIADTYSMGLSGATDIELAVNGDRIEVFVITGADAGISHFYVDLSALGTAVYASDAGQTLYGTAAQNLMAGGAGRDNLYGENGHDILIDGADDDRLSGGNGADLFVFVQDGTRDTITDFNPAMDRIDLSSWAFLYDTTQLVIQQKGGHTRITFRDERLDVVSHTGGLLDPEDLRAAVVIDTNRSFYVPSENLRGTDGADIFEGTWGVDSLVGRGGDDSFNGRQGDDTINGGGGNDTASFNVDSDAIRVIDLGNDSYRIDSSDGADFVKSVEFFEFRDTTLTLSEIRAQAIPDPGALGVVLRGQTNDDLIQGDIFNDTLFGGLGDDHLRGVKGHDLLNGDAGNDSLYGGDGNDVLVGGEGDDRLAGGDDDDILQGDGGSNKLYGQSGYDSLYGGAQNDTLNGGGHSDSAWAYGGSDYMKGGNGEERYFGGSGSDTLVGNRHDDYLDGGSGNDTVNGGGDNDTLLGGSGNDFVKGGIGNDSITGGRGKDFIIGGDGADVFVYDIGDGQDRIVDFNPDEDLLQFSEEILNAYVSADALVQSLASVSGHGVTIAFGGADRIVLSNLSDLDGLADAMNFE